MELRECRGSSSEKRKFELERHLRVLLTSAAALEYKRIRYFGCVFRIYRHADLPESLQDTRRDAAYNQTKRVVTNVTPGRTSSVRQAAQL